MRPSLMLLAMAAPTLANITAVDVHGNIMHAILSNPVVTSATLYEYFKANTNTNHTIYVSDTGKFVSMADVKPILSKRQGSTNICFGFIRYWAKDIQRWWSSFAPASGCLSTAPSAEGGSIQFNWQYSRSISENAGISWNVIADILSASAGITVTETWSHGGTISCNVAGHGGVAQISVQNRIIWGWMWSEGCMSCPYGGTRCFDQTAKGGAEAPVATDENGVGANFRCDGPDEVRC